MSIQMSIPLAALADPSVSGALTELVRALGGTDVHVLASNGNGNGNGARTQAQQSVARRRRPSRRSPSPRNWDEFEATLSADTRTFLDMIADKGTLTLDEAITVLGLPSGKSLGGLTGALARKARNHGIELPYEQRLDATGGRIWVSTKREGSQAEASGQDANPAQEAEMEPVAQVEPAPRTAPKTFLRKKSAAG